MKILGVSVFEDKVDDAWRAKTARRITEDVFSGYEPISLLGALEDFVVDPSSLKAIDSNILDSLSKYAPLLATMRMGEMKHDAAYLSSQKQATIEKAIAVSVDFLAAVKSDLLSRGERNGKFNEFYTAYSDFLVRLSNNSLDMHLFQEPLSSLESLKAMDSFTLRQMKSEVDAIDDYLKQYNAASHYAGLEMIEFTTPIGVYEMPNRIDDTFTERIRAEWKGNTEEFDEFYAALVDKMQRKVNILTSSIKLAGESRAKVMSIGAAMQAKADEFMLGADAMLHAVDYLKTHYDPKARGDQPWSFEDTLVTLKEATEALKGDAGSDGLPEKLRRLPEIGTRLCVLEEQFGNGFIELQDKYGLRYSTD